MARSLASGRTAASNRASVQNFPASLSFNGTSSLLTSAVVPATTGFSLGFWTKSPPDTATGNYVFYTSALSTDGFKITISGTNKLAFTIYNGVSSLGTVTTPSLNNLSNQWVHIAATYLPNGLCTVYINGVLSASITSSGTMSAAGANLLTFMAKSYAATGYTRGSLQNVVFQNSATSWTATQVLALYQNGTIPSGATFVLPLTEGAGTTAYDISGNANNGTITTGTYTTDAPSRTRGLVGGNLVYNGNFEYAPNPAANVATTSSGKWIDGTAAGSTQNLVNDIFGWGTNITGSCAALFDPSVSHSGGCSLKMSTTATASKVRVLNGSIAGGYVGQISAIPCNLSTSYTISLWAKTLANSGSANTGLAIVLEQRNNAGNSSNTLSVANAITTTTGWTQYTGTLTTSGSAGFNFLTLDLQVVGNDGTGTLIMDAWIDDIVITPTVNTTRNLA